MTDAEKKWNEMNEKFKTHGSLIVTFTKKDGTIRRMCCTRDANRIPAAYHPKGEKPVNYEVMPVFDLEATAWKSFRVDSVIDVL